MDHYYAEHDGLSIVTHYCKQNNQSLTLYPLKESPETRPDYEYIQYKELSWDNLNTLSGGDRVSFQDQDNHWWEIFIHHVPRPVDRRGLEKVIEIQEKVRRRVLREA